MRPIAGDSCCLPGWKAASRKPYQAGLRQWLRFIGRFEHQWPPVRWQSWLSDYDRFLWVARALVPSTRKASLRVTSCYLAWQYKYAPIRWGLIRGEDLSRYTALQSGVRNSKSVNDALSMLRLFFRFANLRGGCSPWLTTNDEFGPEVLHDSQTRTLLAAFNRRTSFGGQRLHNHTLPYCFGLADNRGLSASNR
jgi:hypothetical protein